MDFRKVQRVSQQRSGSKSQCYMYNSAFTRPSIDGQHSVDKGLSERNVNKSTSLHFNRHEFGADDELTQVYYETMKAWYVLKEWGF